ncbi:RAI1 like PD-XK nuclease-domain-containing protein [Catenaria anguillulae PL171]|uniref:Decapping nuclease n=1 Tax=Catenaria anguillulae PL171 TaxID=765915 RepID=A0A1Y2HR09_9FUNG|nr:RAI1 like PD-XK nuclease-domain-containing protein [Catenaria anguillulae PL171]
MQPMDSEAIMDHRHTDRNSSFPQSPSSGARNRDGDRYQHSHSRGHRDRYTAPSSSSYPPPTNATLSLRLPVPRPSDPAPPGPAPSVQQPTEIAHFSYDADGQFHADRSSLRYWSPPPSSLLPCERVSDPRELAVPLSAAPATATRAMRDEDKRFLDLNSGFDQYDPNAGPGIEPLDNLLRGLVDHGVWSAQRGGAEGVSIVTWRGIVTKLLVAPYNDRDGWELGMVKHKSTVFIHEHFTPDRLAQEADTQRDPRRARMAYWGYRFEHLCVLATPPTSLSPAELKQAHDHRTSSPLNPQVQYCSVVKTKIGNHRVILGAEVDCCLPPRPSNAQSISANAPSQPLHYLELKTHRLGSGGVFGWRSKLLRIWAQSFLAGIPTIMIGFRDDNGIVRAVREYKTLELPRGVRGLDAAQGGWDPNVCIRFAADAIDKIVGLVRGGEEGVEWMARYVPKDRVVEVFRKTVREETSNSGKDKVWENGRLGGVVPEWFKRGEEFEQRPR